MLIKMAQKTLVSLWSGHGYGHENRLCKRSNIDLNKITNNFLLQIGQLMRTFLFVNVFLTLILNFSSLHGEDTVEQLLQEIPVAYKGRFRPLDAMARLWLEENYHRQTIKAAHLNDFHIAGPSALSFFGKYNSQVTQIGAISPILDLPCTFKTFIRIARQR